jgi:hypothetical protein
VECVARFVKSCCGFTSFDEGTFTCILHEAFAEFCRQNNIHFSINIVKFSELLKKVCGENISPSKWRDKAIKDGAQNGYKGIILN